MPRFCRLAADEGRRGQFGGGAASDESEESSCGRWLRKSCSVVLTCVGVVVLLCAYRLPDEPANRRGTESSGSPPDPTPRDAFPWTALLAEAVAGAAFALMVAILTLVFGLPNTSTRNLLRFAIGVIEVRILFFFFFFFFFC